MQENPENNEEQTSENPYSGREASDFLNKLTKIISDMKIADGADDEVRRQISQAIIDLSRESSKFFSGSDSLEKFLQVSSTNSESLKNTIGEFSSTIPTFLDIITGTVQNVEEVRRSSDIIGKITKTSTTETDKKMDKMLSILQGYSKVVRDVSKNVGVGSSEGGSFDFQIKVMSEGLMTKEQTDLLTSNILSSFGNIKSVETQLRNLIKFSLREIDTLEAKNKEIDKQLDALKEQESSLSKERSELDRIVSYANSFARAQKEQELNAKEASIAEREIAYQNKVSATAEERATIRESLAQRESSGEKITLEERRLAFREVLEKERSLSEEKNSINNEKSLVERERSLIQKSIEVATNRENLDRQLEILSEKEAQNSTEKEKINQRLSEISREKANLENRVFANDAERVTEQQRIESVESSLLEQKRLNDEETVSLQNRRNQLEVNDAEKTNIAKEELNTRLESNRQEQERISSEIAALETRRSQIESDVSLSNEEKAAQLESLNTQKTSLESEKTRNAQEKVSLDQIKTSLEQNQADVSSVISQQMQYLVGEQNRISQEKQRISSEIAALETRRSQIESDVSLSNEEKTAQLESLNTQKTSLESEKTRNAQESLKIAERASNLELNKSIIEENKKVLEESLSTKEKSFAKDKESLKSEKDRINESMITNEKQRQQALQSLNDIENSKKTINDHLQRIADSWINGLKEVTDIMKTNLDLERSVIAMRAKHASERPIGLRISKEFTLENKEFWAKASQERKEILEKEKASVKLERTELIDLVDKLESEKKSGEYDPEIIAMKEKALLSQIEALTEREKAIKTAETGESSFGDAVMRALEPTIDIAREIGSNADLRMSMFEDASKMSWFAAREELKIVRQEERILLKNDKLAQKEYERMMEAIKAGAEVTEEDKKRIIQARKVARDALKDNKSRRKALEERESKGMLKNFLESISKTLDSIKDGFRKATTHWITKLFAALFLLGFLIKRGILSPDRIRKTIAFIVDFLVEGIKALLSLIVTGLFTVVEVIFGLFASGNILAGVITLLIVTITSLMVLATLINLATIAWGKVVGAIETIKSAYLSIASGLEKLGIDIPKYMDKFGSGLKTGLKNMYGGIRDSIKKLSNVSIKSVKESLSSAFGKIGSMFKEKISGSKSAISAPLSGPEGLTQAGKNFYKANPEARRARIEQLKSKIGTKTTAATATTGTMPVPKGADRFGGFLKGIADSLKKLGSTKVLKGAATLALLATSVVLISKAFINFSKVSWQGVAIGLAAIFGLIQLTKGLAKSAKFIAIGGTALAYLGVAMMTLSAALYILALAMQQFNSVEWGSLIKAGIAIITFSYLMFKVALLAPVILAGAAVVALVGVALLPLVYAMNYMKGFEFKSLIVLALGIVTLSFAVASMAPLLPLVVLGGLTVAALGIALMPMAKALSMAKGFELKSAAILIAATYLFGEIAYHFAYMSNFIGYDDILKVTAIIGGIGLAIIPMAAALQMAKGLELKGASILFGATLLFGSLGYALSLLSKIITIEDIAKGIGIIGGIGLAIIPMASALLMARGIDIGAAFLLLSATIIFGSLGYAISLLSKILSLEDVMKGIGIIGGIGLAMIPMAAALHMARGIQIGSAITLLAAVIAFGSIAYAFSFLSKILSLGDILKSSLMIALIGFAVMPMAFALHLAKGIDLGTLGILFAAVIGFTALAALLGAPFMATILPMIAIGALVIAGIGLAVLPMAFALSMVKNVDMGALGLLAAAVGIFTAIAIAIGHLTKVVSLKRMMMGALVIAVVGLAVRPMAETIKTVQNANYGALWLLVAAVGIFTAIAVAIGHLTKRVSLKRMLTGALVIAAVGLAVRPMAETIKTVQNANFNALWLLVAAVGIFTALAIAIGYLTKRVSLKKMLTGALVIAAVGLAVIPMAYALSLTKGINLGEVALLMGSVVMFTAIAALLGAPFMATILPMIAIGALVIAGIGLAVLPMAFALSLVKGLDISSVGILIAAVVGFGLIALAFGVLIASTGFLGAAAIAAGGLIIAALGLAVRPMAKTLSQVKGLDPSSVYVLIEATTQFAKLAGIIGAIAIGTLGIGAIMAGAGAKIIHKIGESIQPMAYALSLAKGISMSSVNVLETALLKFKDIANELGDFGSTFERRRITSGSEVIGLLGAAFIPLSQSLKNVKGIDATSVFALSYAAKHLADAAVTAGENFASILLGSIALSVLGNSLGSLGSGIKNMKGLSIEDAFAMGMVIRSLVDAASYAGSNFISILLGSWALRSLGESISVVNKDLKPFADSMEKLGNLVDPLLNLADSLNVLGGAISKFGGDIGSLSDAEIEKIVKISSGVSSSAGEMSSSGGGIMKEIKTILMETKEIHVQALQGGGNLVAMNQSNVSNSNKQDAPIIKNTKSTDKYFSRLAFKHHI